MLLRALLCQLGQLPLQDLTAILLGIQLSGEHLQLSLQRAALAAGLLLLADKSALEGGQLLARFVELADHGIPFAGQRAGTLPQVFVVIANLNQLLLQQPRAFFVLAALFFQVLAYLIQLGARRLTLRPQPAQLLFELGTLLHSSLQIALKSLDLFYNPG